MCTVYVTKNEKAMKRIPFVMKPHITKRTPTAKVYML
jgi:hypothetical protein